MKLRILSDLHLEFLNSHWDPPAVEADVVVLAGDIHTGSNAVPWIQKHFPTVPVIYILGNHEGYKHDLKDVIEELEAQTKGTNIRFLNDHWTPITVGAETVWFFGGTLWTDFELDGSANIGMLLAGMCMNDYRLIRVGGDRLLPQQTRDWHWSCIEQLKAGLEPRHPYNGMGKSVVVTHHLPSAKSIDNSYRDSKVNPAYASNLEHLMQGPSAPVLWVHGHTHRSKDYVCGNTRVVANPKGYPDGEGRNWDFDPRMVVEI